MLRKDFAYKKSKNRSMLYITLLVTVLGVSGASYWAIQSWSNHKANSTETPVNPNMSFLVPEKLSELEHGGWFVITNRSGKKLDLEPYVCEGNFCYFGPYTNLSQSHRIFQLVSSVRENTALKYFPKKV